MIFVDEFEVIFIRALIIFALISCRCRKGNSDISTFARSWSVSPRQSRYLFQFAIREGDEEGNGVVGTQGGGNKQVSTGNVLCHRQLLQHPRRSHKGNRLLSACAQTWSAVFIGLDVDGSRVHGNQEYKCGNPKLSQSRRYVSISLRCFYFWKLIFFFCYFFFSSLQKSIEEIIVPGMDSDNHMKYSRCRRTVFTTTKLLKNCDHTIVECWSP